MGFRSPISRRGVKDGRGVSSPGSGGRFRGGMLRLLILPFLVVLAGGVSPLLGAEVKLTAEDGQAEDEFGYSVSISGDYALVGALYEDAKASDAGAAYIYHSIDDLSLPVELASFVATAGESRVVLCWRTESELDNLGFHLYRALAPEGPYARLTPELIPGAGNSASAREYSFIDWQVVPGVTYWYELEDVAFDGTTTRHGPISATPTAPNLKPEEEGDHLENFLSPNWPNPFNPDTYIRFGVKQKGHVSLAIYNLLGQRVRTLVDEELEANVYTANWDGTDDGGRPVASGVYFCWFQTGQSLQARKMVLLR